VSIAPQKADHPHLEAGAGTEVSVVDPVETVQESTTRRSTTPIELVKRPKGAAHPDETAKLPTSHPETLAPTARPGCSDILPSKAASPGIADRMSPHTPLKNDIRPDKAGKKPSTQRLDTPAPPKRAIGLDEVAKPHHTERVESTSKPKNQDTIAAKQKRSTHKIKETMDNKKESTGRSNRKRTLDDDQECQDERASKKSSVSLSHPVFNPLQVSVQNLLLYIC
jgi:hypothetical protein